MSSQLHHVVMCSHSANDFVKFLTGVVGMTIQQQFHVPGDLLESTLGWPPSSGTQVTMMGSGDCGLIEVLDVPAPLREVVPEGLAALSFLSNDAGRARERAEASAHDVKSIAIAVRSTWSWAASAVRMPSASASHRRVEPSTSVNKNVTTPEGAGAGPADTHAESHNRAAATSHIG